MATDESIARAILGDDAALLDMPESTEAADYVAWRKARTAEHSRHLKRAIEDELSRMGYPGVSVEFGY